jgi:dihydroxy-acid dehydratase
MSILAEVLGLALAGSTLVPALSEERNEIAYKTGVAVMNLLEKNITTRDIMTREAFENAITVVSAMGGSLNTVLHLPAIAYECGLEIGYDDFDRISRKTPLITRVTPNSKEYTVADLYPVGGILTIMRELSPLLHQDVLNSGGNLLREDIKNAREADGIIIRSMKKPFETEGGIAVLKGNLAPQGAIVKSSAVPAAMWKLAGPAKVFDSEEDCIDSIENGKVLSGDIVVIRYEGPMGGPGMREMHRATEVIAKIPNVAIITDGRFSGASAGLSIGYLAPEAAAGGPIGWVESGDQIEIDIAERRIHWCVEDNEIALRRQKYTAPVLKETESSFLKLYGATTTSASQGAVRRK